MVGDGCGRERACAAAAAWSLRLAVARPRARSAAAAEFNRDGRMPVLQRPLRARALAAAAPVHRRCWELPVPAARARARSCGCHSPGQLLPVAAQAIRVPSTLARQPCQPVLCISRSHACTCIAYCAFMACAPTPALWVQASAAGRRHAAPLPPHMAQAPAGGARHTRACASVRACACVHACVCIPARGGSRDPPRPPCACCLYVHVCLHACPRARASLRPARVCIHARGGSRARACVPCKHYLRARVLTRCVRPAAAAAYTRSFGCRHPRLPGPPSQPRLRANVFAPWRRAMGAPRARVRKVTCIHTHTSNPRARTNACTRAHARAQTRACMQLRAFVAK